MPKVPYDYDYIKNNSKPHFPIDLPGDNSNHHEDHDIDFEQNSERTNEAPSSTPSPKKPTVSIQVLPNFTQYCPPARSRNLFWNWTLAVSVFTGLTPSIAEIICVKNVGAIVVCGFFMK